jgi:hypothetical protein
VTIEWKEHQPPEVVQSWDGLLVRIRQIAADSSDDCGIGVCLQKDSGEALAAIVAGCRWWFLWTPHDYADHGLGSYHSTSESADIINCKSASPGTSISYFYLGHHGEFLLHDGVGELTGIATITDFYSSDGRPGTVTWIND